MGEIIMRHTLTLILVTKTYLHFFDTQGNIACIFSPRSDYILLNSTACSFLGCHFKSEKLTNNKQNLQARLSKNLANSKKTAFTYLQNWHHNMIVFLKSVKFQREFETVNIEGTVRKNDLYNMFNTQYMTIFSHLNSNTDKRTDVWSRDFIIWKINSGLWAVVWAGLWNKRVLANYEQLLRPVFSLFRGQNFF